MPPASGEVDSPMRVIVCSTRAHLVGVGDVAIAADVAELLIALDDERRTTIVVDATHTPIDLTFLARLACDFPPTVALLVEGDPAVDRRVFHDRGIYRAQFDPADEGALRPEAGPIDRAELITQVRRKLARQPTPLVALLKR